MVRITFRTASMSGAASGQLMMLSMPHHRALLQLPAASPVFKVDDLRGELWPVLGSDWYLAYNLPELSFDMPYAVPTAARRDAVAEQLLRDATQWQGIAVEKCNPNSIYFGGGDMAAVGRMALIADQLAAQTGSSQQQADLVATAANLRDKLRSYLRPRIRSNAAVLASVAYDTTWGGLIPYVDALGDTETQFGNRAYNDHQ